MGATQSLVLEYGHPARFRPYANNARTHSPEQLEQIRNSIARFGFINPLLVDEDDEVIAGHGRQEAALGMDLDLVPFIVLRGLSAQEKRALRIADNKIALGSSWDVDLLAIELGELKGLEDLAGFSAGELDALLGVDRLADDDSIDDRPLPDKAEARKTLKQRFGVPPFTVLNAREAWWQDRKRAWLALGLQSELGRLDGAEAAK